MPIRDQLRVATATASRGTWENVLRHPRTLGTYQSIDALNYGPAPLPGVWACKPVTMQKSVTKSSPISGVSIVDNYGYPCRLEGDVCAILLNLYGYQAGYDYLGSPNWSETRANEAINKAYAKIMATDLDVGVMIGELKETLEGIRNPLSGIRNFIKKSGKKAVRKNGSDFVSMLTSSWLEWRYGIRPLIQAVQDIYEHVNSSIVDECDGKLHRKRGRAPLVEKPTSWVEWFQITPWTVEMNMARHITTRYSASVGYNLTAPLTWEERYGLDAYSLPSIAWELTTLSFVVDWWLGIGQWLASLKALNPKVQVQGLSVSMKTVINVEVTTTGQARLNSILKGMTGGGNASFHYEKLIRQCRSPGFNGVTPSLNSQVFDLNRTIDALTLLWQQVAKGR